MNKNPMKNTNPTADISAVGLFVLVLVTSWNP